MQTQANRSRLANASYQNLTVAAGASVREMSAMRTAARDRLSLTSTISEKADTAVQQLLFNSVVPLNNHKTWLTSFNEYTVLQHFDAIEFDM